MKTKSENRAEKQCETVSAELGKDGIKAGNGTIAMSFHDRGDTSRGYQLEKVYRPGAEAIKKPVTSALNWLLTLRGFKVAWALLKRAEAGEVAAIRELLDRTEGKVAEQVSAKVDVNIAVRLAAARKRVGLPPIPIRAEIVKPESGPLKE